MKKLAINALNICDDISNIDSYLLVIKNKKILYKILSNSDLQYENSYIQILDENYKELKLSDYVDFISSIINLDSNSKKNLNVLIRRIKKEEIAYLIRYVVSSFFIIRLQIRTDICVPLIGKAGNLWMKIWKNTDLQS